VAGPTRQATNTIIIPPGEGRQTYSSTALAWYVENLELDEDSSLKSVVGPSVLRIETAAYKNDGSAPPNDSITRYERPVLGSGYGFPNYVTIGARPHSVFCANLLNGSAHTTLYRFGSDLMIFRGGIDDRDEVLVSGLSTVSNPRFPDQYVRLGNNIVWTNGVDRARIITYTGSVFELGYDHPADTPVISGPTQPDFDEVPQYFPNSVGYSWPGRIGTPGDTFVGREGALLSGTWYYYVQYEDLFGNLSPFSSASEPVALHANQADPFQSIDDDGKLKSDPTRNGTQGTEIDDLTRRFLVRAGGDAPEQTVAIRLYRTSDTKYNENVPRFLARVPGSSQFAYDDNKADSELGPVWEEPIEVPVFKVSCAHQGRLIMGNLMGDPGAVRQSQPGRPGTFLKNDLVYPDAGGAEITGLVSHNGSLIAFTENATYVVGNDFMGAQPLSLGVGCVAPRSINALPDGTLIWLGRDGFYGMRTVGDIVRLSQPIDKIFKLDVNMSRLHMAVSAVDAETKEYRCALAASGESDNRLMFCFDGRFWRRQTLGIHIGDMSSTNDWRQYVLAIGSDPREKSLPWKTSSDGKDWFTGPGSRVFVLGRQTTDYFGPPRRIRYRSSWIMAAENGLVPTNVRTLYVGMKDAWNGVATVRVYKNGSWAPVAEIKDLLLVGPDDESRVVEDIAGSAEYNKSRVHSPRLYWRQVPVDLHNVNSWAFEIEMIGFPGPYVPDVEELEATPEYVKENYKVFETLFDSSPEAASAWSTLLAETQEPLAPGWELGRMRLAAFAFDSSVATLGTPLGRVPKRKDQ
jgi:hypothetical protein